MYHNFSGAGQDRSDAVNVVSLRSQLEYLKRHFQIVPLARVFEKIKKGMPLDSRTVALTIDDGRRNCYEFLFPLLKEFSVPATFFVVTSFVRNEDWLWTDKVLWLSEQPTRPDHLDAASLETLFSKLNRLPPGERDAFIEHAAALARVTIPRGAPPNYAACSWAELREMHDSGLVEIGSHTVAHPILSSISDEESWRELTLSRAQIEDAVGCEVSSFCFPNGKSGDYRPSQLRQVAAAGYAGAVVADFGMVGKGSDAYRLARIGVSGLSDDLSFSKELDGLEYFQQKLRTLLGTRRNPRKGTLAL